MFDLIRGPLAWVRLKFIALGVQRGWVTGVFIIS